MNFLYDCLLFLIALPKIGWARWKQGRRRPTFSERLGLFLPNPKDRPVIWIHAVSVGEVKAAQPLFRRLRKAHPANFFLITTTTATGQEEATRSLLEADAIAFLPLDLSWVVRRWVRALRPTLFLLIESDFWWNLLRELKKQNTYIALASGKISSRSAARFSRFPSIAKKLFSHFDLFCVQNDEHAARFAPFFDPIQVTGNLKFDFTPAPIHLDEWRSFLLPLRSLVTIACTHSPEEEELLIALRPLLPQLQIFLAPRHPERFDAVEQLLQRFNLPYARLSAHSAPAPILLIDAMGKLPSCYALSSFAILGGSFTSKVGGHNLLEPPLYGCPVLFGPHTFNQTELAQKVLQSRAGLQLPLAELPKTIHSFLENPSRLNELREATRHLIEESRGASERTFSLLKNFDNPL